MVAVVAGYQLCKASNMTATWTRRESCALDELLRRYWTDVIITHLNSYESLDGVSFRGDDLYGSVYIYFFFFYLPHSKN